MGSKAGPGEMGAMIGIVVAAAIVLLVALVLLGRLFARQSDRRKRKKIAEEIQANEEQTNFESALDATGPSGNNLTRSVCSVLAFYGGNDDVERGQVIRELSMAKVRTSSESKHHFRIAVRDSWPLANIPMSLLPGQQLTMTLNQVAPPGYVVQPDSKWPRRNSSRSSRSSKNSSIKVAVHSPERSFPQLSSSPIKSLSKRRRNQRRSTSETQLTRILRSTSQRLEAAQKQTLTRTLTTFSKFPGSPPKDPLPTPPLKNQNESSEVLIGTSFFESPGSSVYEAYMARTPSTGKADEKHVSDKRDKSATSSVVSDDSLCEMAAPDLVIPGLLTSPSKQSKTAPQKEATTGDISIAEDDPKKEAVVVAQKYRMIISNFDTTSMQNKKSRVSTTAFGKHRSFQNINSEPHRISLAGDPFYSQVKSSKPVFPKTDLQGPRPLYVRKATFGQEATTERPPSYTSPLRDISGNAQGPLKALEQQSLPSPNDADRNPFQWSPQEAMQERPRQSSPKRNGSKRKGHKRSNVIRMSNLSSRPQSVLSVDVVPEEPEEDPSILEFNIPKTAPLRLISPSKSPSPSPSTVSRRLSGRPPSIPTFNPMLTIPDLTTPLSKEDNSDAENNSPTASSPTLSVSSFYLRDSVGAKGGFAGIKESAKFHRTNQYHGRNHSVSERPPDIPPRAKNHRYSVDAVLRSPDPQKLTSFPPPVLSPKLTSPKIALPRPPSNIIVSPSSLSASSPTLLAPPLLTIPIPGHLTGPRNQPNKSGSQSPPRDSLAMSICMLRRMKSEVSHYSNGGSDTSPGLSPELPFPRKVASVSYSPSVKESSDISRARSRGSKHYLSLCPTEHRRGRATIGHSGSMKRSSHPLGIRGARDSQDMFNDYSRRRMHNTDFTEVELKTVREAASPPMSSNSPNALNFQFPVLTRDGSMEDEETPSKSKRWSDAMPKPAVNAVRRESQMEYPSPKTPPIIKWNSEDFAVELDAKSPSVGTRLTGDGRGNGREGKRKGRPESLGLYDEDGFLRSSPFKIVESPGGN
ncbi:hypothetical protein HYALB_00006853 [Hymenoscyphus albidus]|uniref:Uncharacterized protein n=1 Tax=Hymenoscyphus albidus TaxID=595503 RepID=A0A9N9LHL8_9HELO|nr:hypothetical protein HYALB_00006853 [Hymenoscyphus albidus]